jgi:hypothetical protein
MFRTGWQDESALEYQDSSIGAVECSFNGSKSRTGETRLDRLDTRILMRAK